LSQDNWLCLPVGRIAGAPAEARREISLPRAYASSAPASDSMCVGRRQPAFPARPTLRAGDLLALARSGAEQKGAKVIRLHLTPKLRDHHRQGRFLITKLLSDFFQWSPFDKESAQRFILAVIGLSRFEKKLATRCVIHQGPPKSYSFFLHRDANREV
jgi:hypothetical protein